MVVVKLKCKGKQDVDEAGKPIIEPDLPEHKFKWRINHFNEVTGEFEVITEIDENEIQKLLDYLDIDFITEHEKKFAAIKQAKIDIKKW